MRLLSVSRSFCSNVPEMGRYKLSKRGSLPDFGRRADGAASPRRATQGELSIGAVLRRKAETGQSAFRLDDGGAESQGATGGRLGSAGPQDGNQDARTVPAAVPAMAAGESRFSRWIGWLALWWSAWRRAGSRRRPKRGPVQTAFQLETVRVVRNDLTEADLEFVVMKSRRNGGGEEAGRNGGGLEASRPLARLAARLFTAGRPE